MGCVVVSTRPSNFLYVLSISSLPVASLLAFSCLFAPDYFCAFSYKKMTIAFPEILFKVFGVECKLLPVLEMLINLPESC